MQRWEHKLRIAASETKLTGMIFEMGMAGYELVSVTWSMNLWYSFYKRPWFSSRQWLSWECRLLNLLDFRYWRCECEYVAPYGKVISGDCEKHE